MIRNEPVKHELCRLQRFSILAIYQKHVRESYNCLGMGYRVACAPYEVTAILVPLGLQHGKVVRERESIMISSPMGSLLVHHHELDRS